MPQQTDSSNVEVQLLHHEKVLNRGYIQVRAVADHWDHEYWYNPEDGLEAEPYEPSEKIFHSTVLDIELEAAIMWKLTFPKL